MTVRYSVTARIEISEILAYVARDNPRAARALLAAIRRSVAVAEMFPYSGRVVHGETRALPVGKYLYRIFYVDQGEEGISIRNVRSTWRRAPWEAE